MSSPVRVSIGLPVYNGERHLPEALAAIQAQTVDDFELIIGDNASTDATPDIISEAARGDGRIRVVRSATNEGAASNYNRVFHESRGQLFKWASHDDRIAPQFLERCLDVYAEGADSIVIAHPRTLLIDAHGEPIGEFDDRLDLRSDWAAARLWGFANRWKMGNALMGLLRSDALGRTGLIRPYPTSDLVLLAELALLGTFHEIDEPLFERRIHDDSATKGTREVADLDAWFSTSERRPSKLPPMVRFLVGTDAALLSRATVPVTARVAAASTFTAGWAVKRTRVHVGRGRRWWRARGDQSRPPT